MQIDPHDMELMSYGIPVYVTKRNAARKVRKSEETIRRWAEKERVRSINQDGLMVHIGDVERVSFECRIAKLGNLKNSRIAKPRNK